MFRGLVAIVSLILGVFSSAKFMSSHDIYYGILAILNFQVVIILKEHSVNIISFVLPKRHKEGDSNDKR